MSLIKYIFNIEYILKQLKFRHFYTLKKNSARKKKSKKFI